MVIPLMVVLLCEVVWDASLRQGKRAAGATQSTNPQSDERMTRMVSPCSGTAKSAIPSGETSKQETPSPSSNAPTSTVATGAVSARERLSAERPYTRMVPPASNTWRKGSSVMLDATRT